MVIASLATHLFTIYCYAQQPERFAAFTIMPIWLWGGIGLGLSTIAFYFLRAPLSLIMTAVWAVTLLVGADEARVLANFGKNPPMRGEPIPHEGQPVLRILTLNCASFRFGNPANEIAAWQPDVVLLQEVYPFQTRQVADVLYAGMGDYRAQQASGVITRWKIEREIRDPAGTTQQITLRLPNGSTFEVVNLHLSSAPTDLRLWRKSAWTNHRLNRISRQKELALVQQILEQTTAFPETPAIIGGDFNAPASDVVHRQLSRDFEDAFASAGTGWGDTYQRRFPILRIDHIYASRQFIPVRCRAVSVKSSDHRMVVADFVTNMLTAN